jgi:hypothetical protein
MTSHNNEGIPQGDYTYPIGLTIGSVTALMTSHNNEGIPQGDYSYPIGLTIGSVTALMTSHNTEGIPQGDYPYPIGGMPAWPVNATCDTMVAAHTAADATPVSLIAAAAKITDMAFGYDGSTCIPTFVEGAVLGFVDVSTFCLISMLGEHVKWFCQHECPTCYPP